MKWIILVAVAALAIVAAAFIFYMPGQAPSVDNACVNAGGTVMNNLCCNSASDFPNTCLIGACGCAPIDSHVVKVCDCGEGKCWDGTSCVAA